MNPILPPPTKKMEITATLLLYLRIIKSQPAQAAYVIFHTGPGWPPEKFSAENQWLESMYSLDLPPHPVTVANEGL